MQQVKKGDTISVHYHGTLSDGSIFDSSEGRAPLEFTAGSGQVIKGFDDAVMDMKIGDKKTVTIPANEAYGDYSNEMVIEFEKSNFPPDMEVEIGMDLQLSNDQGQIFPVKVVEVKENSVMLDANHPLAGKDLTFALELVSIA